MRIERISSADDARVAAYRDVKDGDAKGRGGLFVVEGEVVLRVFAARTRHRVRSVFLAEKRVDALADALAALPEETPVYVAEQPILDRIAGFAIHRGVLALGERVDDPPPPDLLRSLPPGPALVVAVLGVVNHDNVGGIFRNAAAFGASAVVLDAVSCDPLYRKAIRVSVGASLFVPFARGGSDASIVAALRENGFQTVALTPSTDALAIDDARLSERVAILAGAEGPGLSPEVLASADVRARIPMASGFDSLNVATATGIALFCATRRPHLSRPLVPLAPMLPDQTPAAAKMSRVEIRLTVAALLMTVSLASLEATVVATAMPTVIAELGGIELYGWVSAAYLLASTVTVPLYGKLADTRGRKPILLLGIVLFLAGSMASGLSRTIGQLVAFRILQGLGAGAMSPVAITIVGDLFTVEERGRVQGLFSAVWGVSGIVGPLVGGLIVRALSWRWIFYVNVPLGLTAIALVTFVYREHVAHRAHRIDWLGAATITGASVAILLGTSGGRGVVLVPVGVALLGAFFFIERRASEPILPLSLFRMRLFAVASVLSVVSGGVMMAVVTYAPLFVQGVLGASPTKAGSVLAAMLVGWPVASATVGRMIGRIGFRRPVRIGSVIIGVSSLLVPIALHQHSTLGVQIATGLFGIGMGTVTMPALVAVQSGVGWEQRGVATASNMFFRTIGGALLVGALGAVLATRLEGAVPPDVLRALLSGEHGRGLPSGGEAAARALESALDVVFAICAAIGVTTIGAGFAFPADATNEPSEIAEIGAEGLPSRVCNRPRRA